jgi:Helix-turn-helix domain
MTAVWLIGIAMKNDILLDPYVHGTLMRDLVGHDRKPAAFLVYLWLYAEQKRSGTSVTASHASLAEETGLSRSTSQTAIAWLARRKLISVSKEAVTATPVYAVQTPWRR